jgi:hypothetical protein
MTTDKPGSVRIVAGRYELRDRLGRGGMGVVWRAWDTELGREVAIKEVLVPEDLPPEERDAAHARVRREARSAARLSDEPGVVTVYDVLDDQGHPWVVMQLVQGRSLQEFLRDNGPLSPTDASRVATTLVRTLQAAHHKGIVHRDIKPGNVMLSNDGSVLLADFGIATVEGETAVTRTGTLVGSPEFLAPERMDTDTTGEPPSDLWSLGITLYAAVEGQSPFQRDTLAATLGAVVSAPVPPPARAGALAPVIMGLLERNPQQRLTADQVTAMLQAATAATQQQWRPDGANPADPTAVATGGNPALAAQPPVRAAPSKLHDWRIWAAAGVVLVLLVAAGGVYRWVIWPESSPLYADYELSDDDYSYSVQYPAEWELSEGDDWRASMSHRDESVGLGITTASYQLDVSFGDDESPSAWEEVTRLMGPEEGHIDYSQTLHDPADFWSGDDEWEVAVLEENVTWDEEWLAENEDEETEWAEMERFRIRMQVHPPDDDDWVFWMAWSGPQSERGRYDAIITETMATFEVGV